MSTDAHEPTNTDRIALANALYELAESFALEATLWTSSDAQHNCARTGRLLAEIARQLIAGRANYDKAKAFEDAGRLIHANVVACRRFFTSLLTPPTRGA
ncbi:hypothetical protein [Microbacterium sp. XT11]|uniref:hypothetical protein n=1 Tax=Microbacterium sp. XT11 TaxID=367477 RepID=UPI000835B57A|nr:hypothetical protein [Microbacterium sp. XT11]